MANGKDTFNAARARGNQRIASGLNDDNPAAAPGQDLRALYVASVVTMLANLANGRLAELAGAEEDEVLQLGPKNTNAAFAIGLLVGRNGCVARIIPAAKSVSESLVEFYALLTQIAVNSCHQRWYQIDAMPEVADTVSAADAGLHAEMAVVGAISKHAVRLRLGVVCIGKRVCANCGGQMNGYGIPHGSVIINSDTGTNAPCFDCDPPTQMWSHPYTRSNYITEAGQTSGYQHIKPKFSLSNLQQNRPGHYG